MLVAGSLKLNRRTWTRRPSLAAVVRRSWYSQSKAGSAGLTPQRDTAACRDSDSLSVSASIPPSSAKR